MPRYTSLKGSNQNRDPTFRNKLSQLFISSIDRSKPGHHIIHRSYHRHHIVHRFKHCHHIILRSYHRLTSSIDLIIVITSSIDGSNIVQVLPFRKSNAYLNLSKVAYALEEVHGVQSMIWGILERTTQSPSCNSSNYFL